MNTKQTIAYLDTLPLVEALFWFIENNTEDMPPDVFFNLRERVRTEGVTA